MRRRLTSGFGMYFVGFLAGALMAGGVAYSATVNNTPEGGYLLCANTKTRLVTFPTKLTCPNGNKSIEVAGAWSGTNENVIQPAEELPTPAASKPTKNSSNQCNLEYLLQPNVNIDAAVATCSPKELTTLLQQVTSVENDPNFSIEQKKKAITILTNLVIAIQKKVNR